MDTQRMLEKCRRGQWRIDRDLDFTASKPRPMPPEDERAIVQYFTDMAGIERLAAALFEEQRKRVDDPTMKKIFATFVADEERHAEVAERLAAYYDVRKLQRYETSPSLVAFRKHFVDALRYLSAEIANFYVTSGELLLDVALLRSIDDFVADEMSHRAMELINRDESRHIAVDYYMTEYYASATYQAWLATQPRPSLEHRMRAAWAFANLSICSGPFLMDVFVRPMSLVDPSGKRILEAIKRFQLLAEKPEVARRPFMRFSRTMRDVTVRLDDLLGPTVSVAFTRMTGSSPLAYARNLFTEEERQRAMRMSIDELADEALAAKTLS